MKKSILFFTIILASCLFILISVASYGADFHEILSAQLKIDGEPDFDLESKATAFDLSMARGGAGLGPYNVYLCYDADNIYFACDAKDDFVSCEDAGSADFKELQAFTARHRPKFTFEKPITPERLVNAICEILGVEAVKDKDTESSREEIAKLLGKADADDLKKIRDMLK